jgi:hypothetical protein
MQDHFFASNVIVLINCRNNKYFRHETSHCLPQNCYFDAWGSLCWKDKASAKFHTVDNGGACLCHTITVITKIAKLKAENLAQTTFRFSRIGLRQPLDGVTNPKYKLKCFLTTNIFFFKEKKALAFNRDRCCHLAFCLQLILFHWVTLCCADWDWL